MAPADFYNEQFSQHDACVSSIMTYINGFEMIKYSFVIFVTKHLFTQDNRKCL